MSSMFTLVLAVLLQLELRCTLSDTDIRAIVSIAALATLKPDIFPFAFLFSHKNSSQLSTTAKAT